MNPPLRPPRFGSVGHANGMPRANVSMAGAALAAACRMPFTATTLHQLPFMFEQHYKKTLP
jgi:hypothetical protein